MISKQLQSRALLTMFSLPCPAAALAAAPAADTAAKQAFLGRQAMYLSFEITEIGTRELGAGTPQEALTDVAYRINNSVKFELPLDNAAPGTHPPSSAPMDVMEMMEEGRFIGWTVAAPDDPGLDEQIASGNLDPSRNPMFLPVEFSIDEVLHFRHRDYPSAPWGTETRTSKGRGLAYISRSGMLICDLKKMICDINILLDYGGGTDLVTVTTTSDVPGFVERRETTGPELLLPKIPEDVAGRLAGFAITLPEPVTVTFSGPSSDPAAGSKSAVTVKVTLSPKPAPKGAGTAR